jgi:SAM-dependent methyltransferase
MTDTTERTDPQLRGTLMQLVFGYMASQVLHVGVSLGIAEQLRDGARPVDELAEATKTDAATLYRFLRGLVCLGVVEELDERSFRLTEMGHLLRADHPGSVRNLILLFCGDLEWENWGQLADSVRTGQPGFELRGGPAPFEQLAADPELAEIFNSAMSEGTRRTAPEVIAAYDFSQFGTLVDVGGGDGTLLAAILESVPALRGILFDLPAGSAGAERRLAERGVAERCEVVTGDFFDSVPGGADAYVLKNVIHDWDDERSIAILRNCCQAMGPDGKLILLEPVVPPRVTPTPEAFGAILVADLNMLVATGGRERTEAEFAAILAAADLRLTRVVPTPNVGAYMSVIEAVRR